MTTGLARPVALASAGAGTLAAVLRLNEEHETELSPLDEEGLRRLVSRAFQATVIGEADAFLIALDETADYESPNFLWFRARWSAFVYVDRVAVAGRARRRGLARALYLDLFAAAQAAGPDVVCCEVNLVPPNPASDRLHRELGFEEVGRREGAEKTVRYLVKTLG